MCGIFGFLLSRSLTSSDLQLGKIGTEMLSHRGPDNSSYWADNEQGIFMGHRRLSIIDVSEKSNQPIQKNGIVLVYNGEIYNYLEIAKELKKSGIEFYSSGDAEVVLEAWKYWGESCLDRFDGMFAYALYQEGMLHLITDPFGEKPLYWAQTKDGIYFSSEPTPLVKLLDLNSNFSVDDVTAFLSLGFLPRERTGYSNLSKVNPGTHIAFSRDNYQKTNKYYAPPTPQWYEGPLVELTENDLDIITDSIINSLSIRLRSDVPLGIFLSSGVDSILLAALSVKELSNYPQALTVKFPENSVNDESSNAAKVAEYLGLPHEIIDSSDDVARTDPNLIFDLYGEANDNITVAANYQMSKIARSRIKVAVSGIGGDELFYGYNKYQFILKWRNFLNINEKTRNSISVLLGMMSFDRLDTIKKLMSTSDALRFIAAKNLDAIDWLSNLPRAQDVARELFSDDIDIALLGRHFDLIQTMPFTAGTMSG